MKTRPAGKLLFIVFQDLGKPAAMGLDPIDAALLLRGVKGDFTTPRHYFMETGQNGAGRNVISNTYRFIRY